LYVGSMVFSGGSWEITIDSATAGILNNWKAGLAPGVLFMLFSVTDQWNNVHAESAGMPYFKLRIFDKIVNDVDTTRIEAYAAAVLDHTAVHTLYVTTDVMPVESFIRKVVMYYSPVPVSGDTVAAWTAAGAQTLVFSLISSVDNEWMAVLPYQPAGAVLYWAFFVEDYAGNDNADNLKMGVHSLTFSPVSAEEAMQEPIGYVLIGVLAFGLVFAVSYRVQLSVQSVKRAKKVSAAVKKAAPGKTIGGTSGKSPISKDIPTRTCPVCRAKIGANLDECPYCHKKF
jgi:hypothetical protein